MPAKKSFFLLIIVLLFSSFTVFAQSDTANFTYPTVDADVTNFSFYTPARDNSSYENIEGRKVKNIIFLIGDGMGLSQSTIARMKGCGLNGKLYMEKLPVVGLIRTHSQNLLVTDSAAAGTALACGVKTINGAVAMRLGGKKYKSIMSLAADQGKRTGIVVTSTLSHATPASFNSNVMSRNNYNKIAKQQTRSGVDVMFGGGKCDFMPKSQPGGKRVDKIDLVAEMKRNGYAIVENRKDMINFDGEKVVGFFANGALKTVSPEPSLAEMTSKAIDILSKGEKGFFLMVEGSQIDWACHGNKFENTVKQTLLFDLAVKAAVDYAKKHKDTLVVVTADHETGGLTIPLGPLNCEKLEAKFVGWSTKGHSATPLPIYSFGPGSDKFGGVYDNTEVPRKMADLLGIKKFPILIK